MWRIIAMTFLALGLLRLEPSRVELRGDDDKSSIETVVRRLPRGYVEMNSDEGQRIMNGETRCIMNGETR